MKKIEWEPLHEMVYQQLRSAIMAAQFSPGQKLTIRALAAQIGVSPMPVRAAITRLVAEKALTPLANGTVAIPQMTLETFEELIELRALLEGEAVEAAATRITTAQLDALADIARQLTEAALNDQADSYLDLNQRFKFVIFDAARGPVLKSLIEQLWMQIGPFMRFYSRGIRFQLEIDQHDEIVRCLRQRKGKAARRALEKDILDGAKFLAQNADFAAAADPARD